jgi:hypothetical protein
MRENTVNLGKVISYEAHIVGVVYSRVLKDLIDDFTKSDFKSFWDDFEIFKIVLKYGDLI